MAAEAVETSMYRALAILRFVVMGGALGLNFYRWDGVTRPALAVVVLVVLALWTLFVMWAYDAPARRRPPLLVADLVVTVLLTLMSAVVRDMERGTSLPGFWMMGVVLAWAVHWRWIGGLVAAVAVTAANIAIRAEVTQSVVGNIFLLMIGGPVLGYTSGLLKEMAAARDRAEREAAAAAERARLARAVHDGVLQVLSLVQRRGAELGGDAAELARLAGEQERALRTLVQAERVASAEAEGAVDLVEGVGAFADDRVTVSAPAQPVFLPAARGQEVLAVVRACLDNVMRHAGPDARAWVLLEEMGDRVVVTVRDDGPGIPNGRLEQAAAEGRLGVRESILGRVRDLGGSAELVTSPGMGTEWEMTFPK